MQGAGSKTKFSLLMYEMFNIFKYHVSGTDGKISVRIIILPIFPPSPHPTVVRFFSVDLYTQYF